VGVKEAVAMGGGGEILGGVILAILGVTVYLAIFRKPIRLYLDIGVAPMILAMGIGRIGCLMFGCCFGGVCETESGDKALPWALRFPYGSPAYMDQWERGQLTCPPDLMWVSPLTKRPEPVPREEFANATVSGNETLAEWTMVGQKIHALKASDPASPDLPALEKQRDELERRLAAAGKNAPTKIDVALAAHLAKLSAARPDGKRVTLADLRDLAAGYPSRHVHPTQLYDALALGLMFVVLSVVFRRRRRYGMVVAWTMLLYPVHRFVQEMIRVDNPRDVFGLTISQFLCLVVFALGVLFALALIRFVPKENLPDGVQG
jgi:phosphatidylglycerol:prolipoprotein diacylglycerol transferase